MAGELETLAGQADALDATAAGQGEGEGAAPGGAAPGPEPMPESLQDGNTRMLCVALAIVREASASKWLLDPPLTTLTRELPNERLPELMAPWAAVCVHYGVDLRTMFDHPVAVALATTGPALWGIGQALADELRSRKAKKVAPDATQTDPAKGGPNG